MTVTGAVVDGDDVEQAVLTALRTWLPTYVIAQEQRKGMPSGDLAPPRVWLSVDELTTELAPGQIPAVLVIAVGLDGEPERHEEGRYSAVFLVSVAVVVSAPTHERTRMLARLYAAAIRTSLEQKPPVEDFVIGVEWADEEYDRDPNRRDRAAGYVTFRIHVQGDAGEGPATPVDPDDDPIPTFPDVPTVIDGGVDVEFTPTNGDIP